MIFLRFIFFVPLMIHVYNLIQKHIPGKLPRISIKTVYLCDANIVILTGLIAYSLIHTSMNPNCPYPNCVPIREHSLQPNILLALYTSSFIGPVALKVHHSWAVFASFTICFVSSLLSAVIVKTPDSTYRMIIVCSIMLFLVLYDYERSLKKLYEDSMNLSATMMAKLEIENEKKLVQLKSEEMRILIGNVAHDLKSPLQSFVCELDTLLEYSTFAIQSSIISSPSKNPTQSRAFGESNMGEAKIRESHTPLSMINENSPSPFRFVPDDRKNDVSVHLNIIESVLLLKSICSFMAMLINRAVDFTKVSSGFKLQPRYGTVNLHEVMKWVIQCTSKSSNGVPVELEPFPIDMCDHVITDTQWFSENVLCLVSNAQKFSTDGIIGISCRLVPKKDNISQIASTSSTLSRSFFKSSNRYADSLGSVSEEFMIRVEVEDEGIGIPVDKREDLFQPFKQAQKRAGGTGLGLFSLSKRVESLGGSCGITDRRDGKGGCLFWFTVPYRPDEEAASLDGIREDSSTHIFSPSEVSRTESRVNEVISLLNDRSGRITMGSSQSRFSQSRHHRRNKSLSSETRSHDDRKFNDKGNGKDDEEESVMNLMENTDGLPVNASHPSGEGQDREASHRKNPPFLPAYIGINASVRAFTHESIPLGFESADKTNTQSRTASSKVTPLELLESNSKRNHGGDDFNLQSFREEEDFEAIIPPALKILLVEDSPLIQKTISRALTREGYEVDIAWNGAECLKMVDRSEYQVILMDLQMPVMDGLEACRRLRVLESEAESQDCQRVVDELDDMESGRGGNGSWAAGGRKRMRRHLIIGISANGDDLARNEALGSGMDDFIPKPVSMSSLKDSLSRHRHLL